MPLFWFIQSFGRIFMLLKVKTFDSVNGSDVCIYWSEIIIIWLQFFSVLLFEFFDYYWFENWNFNISVFLVLSYVLWSWWRNISVFRNLLSSFRIILQSQIFSKNFGKSWHIFQKNTQALVFLLQHFHLMMVVKSFLRILFLIEMCTNSPMFFINLHEAFILELILLKNL